MCLPLPALVDVCGCLWMFVVFRCCLPPWTRASPCPVVPSAPASRVCVNASLATRVRRAKSPQPPWMPSMGRGASSHLAPCLVAEAPSPPLGSVLHLHLEVRRASQMQRCRLVPATKTLVLSLLTAGSPPGRSGQPAPKRVRGTRPAISWASRLEVVHALTQPPLPPVHPVRVMCCSQVRAAVAPVHCAARKHYTSLTLA